MSEPIPNPENLAPQEPSQSTHAAEDWHGGMRVCAACGHFFPRELTRCPHCQQDHTAEGLTRLATFSGNWFVFDPDHPVPGVRLDFLVRQARRGYLQPNTVVRGPSTKQQWKFAGEIAGLSHHVGRCWFCGGKVEPTDSACASCHVSFEAEPEPEAAPVQTKPVETAVPVAPVSALPVSAALVPPEGAAQPGGENSEFGPPLMGPVAPTRVRSETNPINSVLLVMTVISVALAGIFGLRLLQEREHPAALAPSAQPAYPTPVLVPPETPQKFTRLTARPTPAPVPAEEVDFFGLTASGKTATQRAPKTGSAPAARETPEAGELAALPTPTPTPLGMLQPVEVQRLWLEADAQEGKGTLDSLKAAAAKLDEIVRNGNPADWPDGLADRIKDLQTKLKKKQEEQSKFFGI